MKQVGERQTQIFGGLLTVLSLIALSFTQAAYQGLLCCIVHGKEPNMIMITVIKLKPKNQNWYRKWRAVDIFTPLLVNVLFVTLSSSYLCFFRNYVLLISEKPCLFLLLVINSGIGGAFATASAFSMCSKYFPNDQLISSSAMMVSFNVVNMSVPLLIDE